MSPLSSPDECDSNICNKNKEYSRDVHLRSSYIAFGSQTRLPQLKDGSYIQGLHQTSTVYQFSYLSLTPWFPISGIATRAPPSPRRFYHVQPLQKM